LVVSSIKGVARFGGMLGHRGGNASGSFGRIDGVGQDHETTANARLLNMGTAFIRT
jgi:hypothetical protein